MIPAATRKKRATIKLTVPHRPSMPSVRLVALVAATTTNIQKGMNHSPKSTSPTKGTSMAVPPAR